MTKRQGPWEGKEERRRAVSPVLCFPPSSVRTFSSRERDLWVRLSEQLTRRDLTSYCKYHVTGNARRLLMSVNDFNSQRSHNWQTILLNDQWSSFLWEDEHISLSLRTVSFLCSLWGSKGDEVVRALAFNQYCSVRVPEPGPPYVGWVTIWLLVVSLAPKVF